MLEELNLSEKVYKNKTRNFLFQNFYKILPLDLLTIYLYVVRTLDIEAMKIIFNVVYANLHFKVQTDNLEARCCHKGLRDNI